MQDGRKTVIDEVTQAVMTDRNLDYAPPEDNFARIAELWTAYLDHSITPFDTAIMMVLLKVARIMHSPHLLDHLVDGAGYFACAADVMPPAPHVDEQQTLDVDNPHAVDGGKPGDILAHYEGMPGFIRDDVWYGREGRKVTMTPGYQREIEAGVLVVDRQA